MAESNSWWLSVTRDRFTQEAKERIPQMSQGKFGKVRVVDVEISAARSWGWPKKSGAVLEDVGPEAV